MNELCMLGFNPYEIKQHQSDLQYICIMISSVFALAYLCQPCYDMNYIGFASYTISLNQSDINYIFTLISSIDSVSHACTSHTTI